MDGHAHYRGLKVFQPIIDWFNPQFAGFYMILGSPIAERGVTEGGDLKQIGPPTTLSLDQCGSVTVSSMAHADECSWSESPSDSISDSFHPLSFHPSSPPLSIRLSDSLPPGPSRWSDTWRSCRSPDMPRSTAVYATEPTNDTTGAPNGFRTPRCFANGFEGFMTWSLEASGLSWSCGKDLLNPSRRGSF